MLRIYSRRILHLIHRIYKVTVSPMLGDRCRFYPSCSQYAVEAMDRFGMCKGGWLALKRIVKCGPYHPGGVDMVPPKE